LVQVTDKRLYNAAIGKCTKLWNISWSPKSAEKIHDICGMQLKRPVPTRWNSLYDALERVMKIEKHLDSICEELNVPKLTPKEIKFLKEFVKVSKPVAMALDRLQGEYGVFMGSLAPTLSRVKTLLTEIMEESEFCKPFALAYLAGIEKRFGSVMTVDENNPSDYVFASLTNPVFKFRLIESRLHDDLKKQFVCKAKLFAGSTDNISSQELINEVDPFFNFDLSPATPVAESSFSKVELECFQYFNDCSNKLSSLSQFPIVEKMFRYYNTPLPSSAPVERVFSYGKLIMTPKRSRLTDDNFQKFLLLKCFDVFNK